MSQENGVKRLVKEAHRRSLWQVMILYLGASWAVLEAADHVIQRFEMPEWAYGTAVLLLLIGFPVVMATAIVQEGVGGGEAREPTPQPHDKDPSAGAPARGTPSPEPPSTLRALFTWRNAIFGGVAAFGLWGLVATVLLLRSGAGAATAHRGQGVEPDALKAIAVLPFDNLSAEADNAYFADGIHEDVLTALSKIADLTVISRTSVLPYRETDKSLREIAEELEVGSILEGSVRRAGDNVRITAQLIDAQTDQHLWADNFDRGLTAANVFAIQTEIARQIADALRATLSPEEETRIAHVPTADLSAYDLYIRGREVYQIYTAETNDEAIRLYRAALEIDPEYAEAWAGIADAYGRRVLLFGYPRAWADSARAYAERAIELAPEVAAGHKALALSFSALDQHARSLEANLRAVTLDPNHHGATNNIGVAYDRMGRLDEALRWYKRSARLNPTTFGPANVAAEYAALGDFERAEQVFSEQVDHDENTTETRAVYGAIIEVHRGDLGAALSRMARWRAENQQRPWFLTFDALLALTDGDAQRALAITDHIAEVAPGADIVTRYHLQTIRGYATLEAGDPDLGARLLEEQRRALEAQVAAGADSPWVRWEIGAIHAALGRREQALDAAEEARAAGLQAGQSFWSELDPLMDSVRDEPRFQALVADSRAEVEQMRRRIEAEESRAGER